MVASNEQRSGRWSLRTETWGRFLEGRALATVVMGADFVVAAEATNAFSSSDSVSVNGKGGESQEQCLECPRGHHCPLYD